MESLKKKQFTNKFISNFPGDNSGKTTPRQTPGVLYSKVNPTAVKNPKLVAWSLELASDLGVKRPEEKAEIDILAGNNINPSMYPYAACYAGHQFGNWAGQLGDGRAITLGEWEDPSNKTWELQLKGAGLTPYSRGADGRAVLRSSVREYLMSEAMHYLGVPTTRALSLVTTGEEILRDMFYDGNAAYEPGAIVMRVAPSFLRFGSFEILAARGEKENLQKLVEWTIDNYYPHIHGEDKIIQWFGEVLNKTAELMVHWMRVGFVHGVMNTDNMSIIGLSIDYGPYSFLDDYDPDFTPNTTDLPGRRYAFGNQPGIAQWNLSCLAGAIAPLLDNTDKLQEQLDSYRKIYLQKYFNMMADKLGFDKLLPSDKDLIIEIEEMLTQVQPDMTIFFQLLIDLPPIISEGKIYPHFSECFYDELNENTTAYFIQTIKKYKQRIDSNTIPKEEAMKKMRANNPRFILRNYLLHQAIEELEKGNSQLFRTLEEAIKDPYTIKDDHFFAKRPEWASKKAGCSMLSCSS